MNRLLRILWRWLLLALLLLALAAGCEDLILRYRLKQGAGKAVLDQVTIYSAAELKNGRVEVYFDRPELRECVHALFPHFGDAPCWYVKRHPIQLLSRLAPGGKGAAAAAMLRRFAAAIAVNPAEARSWT